MAAENKVPPPDTIAEGEEPPPRGVRTAAAVRWAILAGTALLALFMWLSYAKAQLTTAKPGASAEAPRYHCPMHPQIVSSDPGECPICHMDLVPLSAERGGAMTDAAPTIAAAGTVPAADGFICPMHPEVHSAAPGRCPVCKMALEPSTRDAGSESVPVRDGGSMALPSIKAKAGAPAPGSTPPAPGSTPPGTTPIKLALDRIQLIGVRTAVVEEGTSPATLRVTAVVLAPEQGVAEVHVRSAGFVEAIRVDQTGIAVQAGQSMLSLYSPELLQAQNELLATRRWAGDAGATSGSARRKLELLGMTPADIDRVIEKGEAIRAISVTTPRGGFVTKKNVVLGSYVTPETALYEVQDLSRVYVVADVFLPDAGSIGPGTEGHFVPSGRPERAATAKVDLVYPLANAEARTRRVRLQLRNEGGKLYAPGEYGTVEFATPMRKRMSIPRDALIDTGSATYVFVVEAEGRFVPRVVAVADANVDRIFLDAGLAPGERVVSGATFLIDSESRLQASVTPR